MLKKFRDIKHLLFTTDTMPLKCYSSEKFPKITLFCGIACCYLFGFTLVNAAEQDEGIHPYIDYSLGYDSNVLRLHDSAAAQTVTNSDNLSDTMQHIEGGINAAKQIGQQNLSANLGFNHTRFDRFSALNYSGRNLLAKWNWHLGNHLQGEAGATDIYELTPFVNFNQLERNLRTQRKSYVNGSWIFHPSWQLRSGFTHYKINYDLTSQSTLDVSSDTIELGLDYLPSTSSSIGIQARHIRGAMPNQEPVSTKNLNFTPSPTQLCPTDNTSVCVDNSYTQKDLMAKIDWQISGKSRLEFLGGYVERNHDSFSSRDFTGFNTRLTGTWLPTDKIGLVLNGWREIGAYDALTTSYTLNRGISLTPTWNISAKVKIEGLLRYETRKYLGEGIQTSSALRTDTLRYASVSLEYVPWRKLQVGLTAYHDGRNSTPSETYSAFSYQANGLVINSHYQF